MLGDMLQKGAFVLLVSGLSLAACGVGNDTTPPHDPDPRLCAASGTTTGTWTQILANPDLNGDGVPDALGCWDDGTWSFSATVATSNCTTAPVLLSNYQFKSTHTIDPAGCTPGPTTTCELSLEMYSYVNDPNTHNHTKTSNTAGGCEGQLELFSADGKTVWNFRPLIASYSADHTTGTLTGQWEYAEFADDQWTVDNP